MNRILAYPRASSSRQEPQTDLVQHVSPLSLYHSCASTSRHIPPSPQPVASPDINPTGLPMVLLSHHPTSIFHISNTDIALHRPNTTHLSTYSQLFLTHTPHRQIGFSRNQTVFQLPSNAILPHVLVGKSCVNNYIIIWSRAGVARQARGSAGR